MPDAPGAQSGRDGENFTQVEKLAVQP